MTTNATASDATRVPQNSQLARPAVIAPGTARINALSTSSITAIDTVSAARATRNGRGERSPARSVARTVSA